MKRIVEKLLQVLVHLVSHLVVWSIETAAELFDGYGFVLISCRALFVVILLAPVAAWQQAWLLGWLLALAWAFWTEEFILAVDLYC